MSYTVTVEYEGQGGESYREGQVFDLSSVIGVRFIHEYGVHHVAKELKELNKTLAK